LEIAQLHLVGGSPILFLRRGGVVEVFLEFSEACPKTISWDPLLNRSDLPIDWNTPIVVKSIGEEAAVSEPSFLG
jgi:hypothetical protein